MGILIVVSHPDDEVLGCGATAAGFAEMGESVRSCILSGDADARHNRPETEILRSNTNDAQKMLGFGPAILGSFPNIRLNTVPHIDLVRFVESAIEETGANMVFTHHPNDVNDDHRHTSRACQAAVRLFQRREGIEPLKSLYFMEILSATDWTFPSADGFRADAFFEIGEKGVELKLAALQTYEGVLRNFPHPRSKEVIKGLAAYRGAQAGMKYAEAFQTAFNALHRSK